MEKTMDIQSAAHVFDADERASLYKTILNRRDVRGQFLSDDIPDDILARVLMAAHHAPSVGFMQPWNFMIIKDDNVRGKVHDMFKSAHEESALMFDDEKQIAYRKLKLEGILESPMNICITCDRDRTGPVVIGRTTMKEMDLYSSVCAVQNFWLAARAEGLGVGWVSIMHREELQAALGLPERVVPIAYLCVGYVSHFFDKPELETTGWLKRTPLEETIMFDQWDNRESASGTGLLAEAKRQHKLVKEERFISSIKD